MVKILFIIGMLLSMALFRANGQKVWSIDDCVNYAVRNNLSIEKKSLQNEINQETYNQSIRSMLPSAGLNSGGGFSFGKSVDPTTYTYVTRQFFSSSYSLGGSIGLFSGFSHLNTVTFNKLNYLAGLEESKQQKNEIAFDALSNYIDVLFYQGLLNISIEQKQLSELNLKLVKVRYQTGLDAKSDLLEMESRMAQEELNVVQSKNYLSAAILTLRQTMNYHEADTLKLDENPALGDVGNVAPTEEDTVISQAMDANPEVKAARLQNQAAEKNLAIARGRLFPSLSMSGGYSTNYAKALDDNNTASFGDQFKHNASQYISFSLSVPLFYGWSNRSQVKKAKLGLLQAKTDLDITKQQLFQEIEKNFNELASLSAEYKQTVKQLEASKLAYEAAEKKLKQGLINAIDFYNSKNLMAKAESDVLRTKLQYELKKRTIDFFIGIPIYSE